jgi:hypothetical protein
VTLSLPTMDKLKRLRRKYGQEFPDLGEKDEERLAAAWRKWMESQREAQEPQMRDRRLHWARHRNFRVGNQHISSRDGRTWREPGADKNTVRAVVNIIGPSLDFRHGVIAEQHPGFRHNLSKATIEARERAEAQQAVSEHYFHKTGAWRTFRDAIYHAQTDGVCFVHVYVDKMAGPRTLNTLQITQDDPRFAGFQAQGYELDPTGMILVPLSEQGDIAPAGTVPTEIAEGDLVSRIVLAHDTFVDPEARTLNGDGERARWFAVRRPRDLHTVRIQLDNPSLKAEMLDTVIDPSDTPMESVQNWNRGLPPFPSSNRMRYKECVYEWTIYIPPDGEDLPEGLWVQLVGDQIVDGAAELPGGVIPFARFTDGSPDPSFYPRPTMSDWLGDQITVNALTSTLIQQSRVGGMGRLMALKGTLINESYNNIVGSLLEYEGMKPEQLQASRASGDVWQMLQFAIRKLEDKTGWNDLARGQVLGEAGGGMQDVSGRAVLGAREMLERTFGPMVQAAAEGATEWAEIIVPLAAWLFGDTPRMIPITDGRGDLAKMISQEQLEGDVSVYVDPATLMPQPAQLRQQTLIDLLQRGWITLAEYQKRAPYAEIRNVYMGDVDHFQRAQWLNTLIEEKHEQYVVMQPTQLYTELPVLWQDEPTVHLAALNELILNERKPWPMRKLAMDRATIYEQLAQAKADPMQPVPLEVMGVPLNRLQAQQAPPPGLVPTPQGAPAVVPGNSAQGQTAPAPGLSAAGAPPASTDTAQPLGSMGSIEGGSAAGQQQ